MIPAKRTYLPLLLVLALLLTASKPAQSRDFRVNFIPNGNHFSCNTCHVFAGGDRNAFGLQVQALVTPGGGQHFWGPDLAALDADGDGFSNGEELQDPEGLWKVGDPAPGMIHLVSNPGNPDSMPPVTPSPTPSETPTATPTPEETPTIPPYDLNGDGRVDAADLMRLIGYIRQDNPDGDYNLDGRTSGADLLYFAVHWENEGSGNQTSLP